MIISVQLFAAARERLGKETVEIELNAPATVADLRERLTRSWPQLNDLWPHCLFAVNEDYATQQMQITEQDAIACIPPVSGG